MWVRIRTGKEYFEGLRGDREVWINIERDKDVATHPAFKMLVDVRTRIYGMTHESKYRGVISCEDRESGERNAIALFAHLNAVYNYSDFSGPLEFVKHAAGLSDRVMGGEAPKKEEKVA